MMGNAFGPAWALFERATFELRFAGVRLRSVAAAWTIGKDVGR